MRLSQKTTVIRKQTATRPIDTHFDSDEFFASVKDQYNVIFEKAYKCPCISQPTNGPLNICKNCGGVGWFFVNPTETKMIITSIIADDKLKEASLREWGHIDLGSIKVTALNDDKLSFMDRITLVDATAENTQIVYPKMNNNDDQLFAYTQYNIDAIDFIGLFETPTTKIKRLIQTTDYTFHDNIVLFDSQYDALTDPTVTIRYVHKPVFHISDIMRESISQIDQNGQRMYLPVHAVAKRAHLVRDVENLDGDRLLDNSWLPDVCEAPDLTTFQRQLKYTSVQTIYDTLTSAQKVALEDLICGSDSV
jgi:hypothetical protein